MTSRAATGASRRVLVVGQGASGITAVQQLRSKGMSVHCVEARPEAGGVWNYQSDPEALELSFDPQGRPVFLTASERANIGTSYVSSAIYDCLRTNLPHPLMSYRGTPFENGIDLFPARDVVTDYLKRVAESNRDCVSYSTLATRCRHNPDPSGKRWLVNTKDISSGTASTDEYDCIVAASGHYSIPFIPYYNGLWLWRKAISHGREYRTPEKYAGKNVLVVGAKASGYDITREIAESFSKAVGSNQGKVYQSVRDESKMFNRVDGEAAKFVSVVPAIQEFAEDSVTLVDGRVLTDVDVVLFATGYLFSFPFLDQRDEPFRSHPLYGPPALDKTPAEPIGETVYPPGGLAPHNLDAANLFYYPDPTLVFPTLQYSVVPFPLAQTQSRYIASYWSGHANKALKPGLDAASANGWAEDQAIRDTIFLGLKQFDYEDELLHTAGEGGANEKAPQSELHEDGTFTDTSAWRRGLRVSAAVLKTATLGY